MINSGPGGGVFWAGTSGLKASFSQCASARIDPDAPQSARSCAMHRALSQLLRMHRAPADEISGLMVADYPPQARGKTYLRILNEPAKGGLACIIIQHQQPRFGHSQCCCCHWNQPARKADPGAAAEVGFGREGYRNRLVRSAREPRPAEEGQVHVRRDVLAGNLAAAARVRLKPPTGEYGVGDAISRRNWRRCACGW